MPTPLPNGLGRIPRGLPPTPVANFLPVRPDELLGRCITGEEYVPKDDVAVAPNFSWAGEGVPNDTDRGECDVEGVRRGDGRLLDGDAL